MCSVKLGWDRTSYHRQHYFSWSAHLVFVEGLAIFWQEGNFEQFSIMSPQKIKLLSLHIHIHVFIVYFCFSLFTFAPTIPNCSLHSICLVISVCVRIVWIALLYSLKSGKLMPSALFFLKISLVIWGLLWSVQVLRLCILFLWKI